MLVGFPLTLGILKFPQLWNKMMYRRREKKGHHPQQKLELIIQRYSVDLKFFSLTSTYSIDCRKMKNETNLV